MSSEINCLLEENEYNAAQVKSPRKVGKCVIQFSCQSFIFSAHLLPYVIRTRFTRILNSLLRVTYYTDYYKDMKDYDEIHKVGSLPNPYR